jgi:hypothetical protein
VTGDDEHVEEIDPQILGPFATRTELVTAIEELPTWVLPPRKEHDG